MAGIGEELELAHLRSKRGGSRVLDLCVRTIDAVVAALAERPVRRGQDQGRVRAMRDRMCLALRVHGIRELHVCVVHHREDLARLRCKHACLCKELLLLWAQRMGLECTHAVEGELVEGKARRALIPCGKVGIGKRKECWLEPGTGGIDSGLERDDLGDRVLPAAHAGILVGLPAGIVPDALELHRRLVVELEIGKKVLAGLEGLVLPGGVGMRQLLRFDECLSEGILICEERCQVPGILLGHLRAGGIGIGEGISSSHNLPISSVASFITVASMAQVGSGALPKPLYGMVQPRVCLKQ